MEHFALWLGAFLTLGILSFLYKDNPWYKLSEAIFVGISAGYWVVILFWDNLVGKFWDGWSWEMVTDLPKGIWHEELMLWVGMALGLLMILRLVPKIGWISRWPLAFIVGSTAGLWMMNFLASNIMVQVQATISPPEQLAGTGLGFFVVLLCYAIWAVLTYIVISFLREGLTTPVRKIFVGVIGLLGVLVAVGMVREAGLLLDLSSIMATIFAAIVGLLLAFWVFTFVRSGRGGVLGIGIPAIFGLLGTWAMFVWIRGQAHYYLFSQVDPVLQFEALFVGHMVVFIGTFTGLVYFFFSKEHTGVFGSTARVGIFFIMITFGASFGYTVMSRMSLLIGRIDFLLGDWLGMIG